MAENSSPNTPRLTVEEVVGWARKALELISDPMLAEVFDVQIGKAQERNALWAIFDVLNREDIAYLRQMSAQLAEAEKACRASWPEDAFKATFETPRPGHETSWLQYVTAQVAAQVGEYAQEQVELEAETRENAVALKPYQRRDLGRAIQNAESLLNALDPSAGELMKKRAHLSELSGLLSARAAACKQSWPEDRYQLVLVTPKSGHEFGWLMYVTGQVARVLSNRVPEAERLEKAIVNAEKMLAVLRPDSPFWCRKCLSPLPDGKFPFCETCHKAWLDEQEAPAPVVEAPTGLHRAVTSGQLKQRRRHAERREANRRNNRSRHQEDLQGFESEGDGKRKRDKKAEKAQRRGEG